MPASLSALRGLRAGRIMGQRGQQGGRVIAAAVHHAVNEQGGGAEHLARGQAAVHVAADPVGYRGAGPVAVEGRDAQAELGGVPAQVAAFERLCRWNSSPCMSQNRSCSAAASAAAAAARACGWMLASGKCRNANRMVPPSWRSICSIAWNACREYGHS